MMAKKADYFLDLSHNTMLTAPGFFQSHGSEEFNALRNKACTAEKIKNSKSYTFFYYNKDNILDLGDPRTYSILINNSRGCIQKFITKNFRKIEIENRNGIEQNKFCFFNTGANLMLTCQVE